MVQNMPSFISGGFLKQHWWLTPFMNSHLLSNNTKTAILESFVIDWDSHDCEPDLCICLLQVWKTVWPRRTWHICSQAVTYQPFTTYRPLNGFGRAFPLNQTSLQMRMSNLDTFFYNLRLLYNRCLRCKYLKAARDWSDWQILFVCILPSVKFSLNCVKFVFSAAVPVWRVNAAIKNVQARVRLLFYTRFYFIIFIQVLYFILQLIAFFELCDLK